MKNINGNSYFEEGDIVLVGEKQGVVRYVYTNGYVLVQFPGVIIHGGIFNNDSTFKIEELSLVGKNYLEEE